MGPIRPNGGWAQSVGPVEGAGDCTVAGQATFRWPATDSMP